MFSKSTYTAINCSAFLPGDHKVVVLGIGRSQGQRLGDAPGGEAVGMPASASPWEIADDGPATRPR